MSEKSQSSASKMREAPDVASGDFARMERMGVEEAETWKRVAERDILVARRKDLDQNREERKKYTQRTFWGAAVLLAIVLAILLASGFKFMPFELPGYVLAILFSGTIIGVGGVVGAIMASLYKGGDSYTEQPRRRDSKRQEK